MLKIKKLIAGISALAIGSTILTGAVSAATNYPDVASKHWANNYITTISELGAFQGYEDGTFRPDSTISYQEFVKVVVSLIYDGEITEEPDDYSLGWGVHYDWSNSNQKLIYITSKENAWSHMWPAWSQPYLDVALDIGLLTYDDEEFSITPTNNINREEMAKVIARATNYLGEEDIADTSVLIKNITDFATVEEESKNFVAQAYCKGILTGYEDGSFDPGKNLTRAEASAVFVRLADKDKRILPQEKTYDYFGTPVTWTQPLRTDVPEELQLSLSDNLLPQSSFDYHLSKGEAINTFELTREKNLLLGNEILKTVKYDNGVVTFTIPDILPKTQMYKVTMIDGEFAETDSAGNIVYKPIRTEYFEPGTYSYTYGGEYDEFGINIVVRPTEGINEAQGAINVEFITNRVFLGDNTNGKGYTWVQGQSKYDYKQ